MQTTAAKVLDSLGDVFAYWYLRPDEGRFDQAWEEFCRVFNLGDFFDGSPAPDAFMWAEEEFEEWYLFSFKLSGGKTPLECYLGGRSVTLDPHIVRELRALVRTQHFGVFVIERGVPGSTVRLRDLYTGERFLMDAAELRGKPEVRTVTMRVAHICGDWHVVGAFIQFLPDRYLQAMATPLGSDLPDRPIEHLPRYIGFVEVGRLMALSMSRYVRDARLRREGEVTPGNDVATELHQVLQLMREDELIDSCA